MSFPRYPKYKDSGVEWLGEVPEHWEVCRTDSVLGTCRSTINADTLSDQTVFHYSIPVVQETGDGQLEEGSDIDSGKLVVTEPQVLVSKLNPRKGTVCIAHPRDVLTVCSSEFVPLLPRRTDIRFIWYVVQSDNYRTRLESLVESATKSHQRAAPSDIYRLMWAFPPGNEQTAIAAFLDRETAKIDALIAEQQRLIELLQEKRQAVISHAVTKGLNPDVPMKDSGIEWLGEVPEHWEIAPLRRLTTPGTTITYGIVQAGPDTEGGVPYIRTSDMSGDELPETGYLRTTADIDRSYARSKVIPDDLVVAIRASLGKGLLVPDFLAGANLTQGTARVSPGDKLLPRFLLRAFNSEFCQTSIDMVAKGTTFREITLDALRRIALLVPPISEQREIVAFLDAAIHRSDELVARARHAITLLQERRSALISAAVTGQIDVRGLAGSEAA